MGTLLQIAKKLRGSMGARKIPRMLLEPEQIRELMEKRSAALQLADRLAERLRTYPHFIVIKRTSSIGNPTPIFRLMKAIASIRPRKVGLSPRDRRRLHLTRIEINPENLSGAGFATRYSNTNEPLALHTDDSFSPQPAELVGFDFVRTDPRGGDSLVAAIEDVAATLDGEAIEILKKPAFPFGRGDHPVLWERNGAPCIRYSRIQIDKSQASSPLTERCTAAMKILDQALCSKKILFQFHAQAGETILLHNTKVLHGRTGFAADSDRLMYRARIHAGCLE